MITIILPLAVMLLPLTGASTYVGKAHSHEGDDICFDLPQGLVDWYELAERSLGAETLKQPTRKELVQNYFEPGAVSILKFQAPVPREVSDRSWLVLHESGFMESHPTKLRGSLYHRVDRSYKVLGKPLVFGEACFHARDSNLRAAFVLGEAVLLQWSIQPAHPVNGKSGRFYISLNGQRYQFENPSFAVPRIKEVVVFIGADEGTIALAVWESDPHCEKGCCEYAYSLYRLGADGATHLIDENGYGCDV